MTQISFWGGIGKIGGNKILISPQNTNKKSILLDFGKDFNIPYIDTFLNPRKFNMIEDYITLGLIPEPKPNTPFHGLYREDLYFFKPKVKTLKKKRDFGIEETDNFLNIRVPCKNIEVISTKCSFDSLSSRKHSITFRIQYEGEKVTVYLTDKHLDEFIAFFNIVEEKLLNLIESAGVYGSEEINKKLTDIVHIYGDKSVFIDCSYFEKMKRWYIFKISEQETKSNEDIDFEYQRNYEMWNKRYGYNPIGEPQISHVLITHSHSDHVSEIGLLDPRVINVCGKISKELLDHFEYIQSGTLAGIVEYYENFILVPYKKDEKRLRRGTKRDFERSKRKFITLNSNEILTLDYYSKAKKVKGAFKIQIFEVDHSISGAGAYLIEDIKTNKKLIYTGDIRLHGPPNLRKKTRAFLDAARNFRPDALICEGTNISSNLGQKGEVESEEKLEEELKRIIKGTNGLVMFASSLRDLSRFNSFIKAAKENNRKLAVMPNTYKLIERINSALQDKEKNIVGDYSNVPLLDEDLVPYISRKGWGLFAKEDYHYQPVVKEFFSEELEEDSEIEEIGNAVKIDDISINQNKYVMYLPFWALFDLIDLRPVKGSIFIHSKSEPFDVEMEIEQAKLSDWLNLFNIGDDQFYQVHCSGHARMKDIVEIINHISPNMLFPVHSVEPDLFQFLDLGDIEVIIPEYGKQYKI